MKTTITWAAFAACLCAFGGENLLKNSSFAEVGADGVPVGWTVTDKSVWHLAKGEGPGGSDAMLFDCSDGNSHAAPSQTLSLEPGRKYVYTVKVRHENLNFPDPANKRNNGVQFCLIGLDSKGERTCGYFSHGSQGTRDWYELREYIMDVPIWTKSAKFSFSTWGGLNGKAWFADPKVEEYVPPKVESLATSAYRDKAWYGKVRLAAALNLTPEEAKATKGEFVWKNAKGDTERRAADSMDAETAFLALSISEFARGEQTLRFELSADGKALGAAERAFTRLDSRPKEYMVWHDEHGRWVVNGRPFFPFVVGVGKKDMTPEHLATVTDAGFNTMQAGSDPDDVTWDYCLTNGLKITRAMSNLYYGERWTARKGWKSYDDQYSFITNKVLPRRGHKALLAWYLNDETRPAVTPKMLKQQKLFEEIDPGHPTTSTWDHPEYIRGYIGCFDECDIDPYPIGRWPVSQVSDWLIPLKAGAAGVKPFGVTVQAMDWMWFRMGKAMATPHFPTFGELRNMTWQAIAAGAASLKYYGFNHFKDDCAKKDYERNYAVLKSVSQDVRKFIPVILSVEEPVKVTVPEKSRLLVRSWRMGNDSFVLVVNALGEGARAELKLSESFPRGFLELGEGVTFAGGDTMTVEMEPLGVAIVHLTGDTKHLVMAGDSRIDGHTIGKIKGRGSWGESFRPMLKDGVEMVNLARGGRSTRTFRDGDHWGEVLAKTRPGDVVVISFGHNDSSPRGDRGVGVEKYGRNLGRFAAEVRAKRATPVFVTPVATCTFGKDGKYDDSRGLAAYATEMKRVAAAEGVALLDLNARTLADVKSLGRDKAAAHYMMSINGKDNTHTTQAGAERYAAFAAEEARKCVPSIAELLK